MSLIFGSGPYAVSEINLAALTTGTALTQAQIQQIAAVAMAAAVRTEHFVGFYHSGDTVTLPVSPVDGYSYARTECIYFHAPYSSTPPSSLTPGQISEPGVLGGGVSGRGGAGQLLELKQWYIEQLGETNPGLVHLLTNYYVTNGSESPTNDGIVLVLTIAVRNLGRITAT